MFQIPIKAQSLHCLFHLYKRVTQYSLCFVVILLFNACSSIPTYQERVQNATYLMHQNDLTSSTIQTSYFSLFSISKINDSCDKLHVYIEGDGLSWVTRYKVSSNPTPINPLAMKLYFEDDAECKVYFARPCQYTNDSLCSNKYWTSHRFSKEVINSYNEALDTIPAKKKELVLFGYSGGAAIVALVASKRQDVTKFITIAGNLDHAHWSFQKKYTPLNGSLNPVNFTQDLQDIPQVHLIAKEDKIIDESIVKSYLSYFEKKNNIEIKKYEEFTHHKGWVENWKAILNNNLK